jgi:hypothetical protein
MMRMNITIMCQAINFSLENVPFTFWLFTTVGMTFATAGMGRTMVRH